jgi:hypothetical protein
MNIVMQEAKSGGAEEVIKRQNDGVHIISPVNTTLGAHLRLNPKTEVES